MIKKTLMRLLCLSLAYQAAWAAAHVSAQKHGGSVSALSAPAADGSFFSGGGDGVLVRWTPDGRGEHYQVSELPIKLFALHPNGSAVALYETDGFAQHRVSVWDWRTLKRTFARRFQHAVTALSFTQQGKYLMTGTASVDGVVFFNSRGATQRKLKEPVGTVSLLKTSGTEASCLMYAPSGSLLYYDLNTGARKAEFKTEAGLEQVVLYGNSLFIAGVRGGEVVVVSAADGKTLLRVPARDPLLFASQDAAYYAENRGADGVVKVLGVGRKDGALSANAPAEYARFSLSPGERLSCGAAGGASFRFGTDSGNVYAASVSGAEMTLNRLTETAFERIYDIAPCADGDGFYFIAKTGIYRAAGGGYPLKAADNPENDTNILAYGDGVIVWAKDARRAVSYLNPADGRRSTLFSPSQKVRAVRLFGSRLLVVEGAAAISIYDFDSAKASLLYSGTGIQDAALYRGELLVAKAQASNPRSPLVSVNVETKETVPLDVSGEVAYALACGDEVSGTPAVYGIAADISGTARKTVLFAYYPDQKRSAPVFQLADENAEAFVALFGDTLYTNMGKTQVISYNVLTRKQAPLERGASLPVKLTQSGDYLAALNADGTVSWYVRTAVVGNLRLLPSGEWERY